MTWGLLVEGKGSGVGFPYSQLHGLFKAGKWNRSPLSKTSHYYISCATVKTIHLTLLERRRRGVRNYAPSP